MLNALWVIAIIVLIIFLLSLIFKFIAGPLLWILLVVAVVLLIIWLVYRVRFRR